MFFSTSGSSVMAAQTLEDIDKTLDATLDICNSSKDLLTDAERTNFLNNHTRYNSTSPSSFFYMMWRLTDLL